MNKGFQKNKGLISVFFLLVYILQLFTPFTVLDGQVALAKENPCKLLPESSPDVSDDYAGIVLDRAAEFLSELDDITGAYYDDETNSIVFIGTSTTTLPEFNKDDLAVAIKSIIFNNSIPSVSIEFQEPFPDENDYQDVIFTGGIEDTNFAHTLLDADIMLKLMVQGYYENDDPIVTSVPGHKSVLTRYIEYGPDPELPGSSRYWISPQLVTLKESTSSNAFVFEDVVMQVQTESLIDIEESDPAWLDASDDFVAHLTQYYDDFAEEISDFEKVKQLAKIVGVVKWIKDNNIGSDFEWVKDYEITSTSTPEEIPIIVSPFESGYAILGGIDYYTSNTYENDTQGTSTQLQSDSEIAAASSTDNTHWTFTSDGEVYDAVAFPLDTFKSIGAYTYSSVDATAPSESATSLEVSRSYSSFAASLDEGMGYGWSFLPVSMENVKPGIKNTCNYQGVFPSIFPNKLAIVTKDYGKEIFTFSCPSGYQPDDAKYHSTLLPTIGDIKKYSLTTVNGDKYIFYADDPHGTDNFKLIESYELNSGDSDEYGRIYNWSTSTGKLLTIQDMDPDGSIPTTSNSHNIAFDYNLDGRVSAVTSPQGTVQFGYSLDGDLTTVVDMRGNTTTYAYAQGHLLESVTDREGAQIIQNEYDDLGRVATQTSATNLTRSINYDEEGLTITWNDSNGRTGSSLYDNEARIVHAVDSLNSTTTFVYNATSTYAPSSVIDANGATTSFTYNSDGRLISVINNSGDELNYSWDNYQLTQVNDGRYTPIFGIPRSTKYLYTTATSTLLSQSTLAGQATTSYTYTPRGLLSSSTDSGGTEHFYYNNYGLISQYVDKLGQTTSYDYDNAGNLIQVIDTTGATTTYTYDSNGNRLTTTNALSTVSYVYDANDRVISIVDPLGATTTFTYNNIGTLATTTNSLNESTHYYYDSYNNLVRTSDALSRDIEYSYDVLNRETGQELASGKVYSAKYDVLGNPIVISEPNGTVATSTYDSLGRLISAEVDGELHTYTYDDAGRLNTVKNDTGTTTYAYDVRDRVTQITNPYGISVAYEYDDLGNVTMVTYPDSKTVENQFDDAGRLTQQTDWNNDVTTYTYTSLGLLSTTTLPNGITLKRSYDSVGRLSSITYKNSSQNVIYEEVYMRDAEGNLIEIEESGNAVPSDEITYDYDLEGRLTSVNSSLANVTYDYDEVGNLIEIDDDGNLSTFTHNVDDELASSSESGGGEMALMMGGDSLSSMFEWAGNAFAYVAEAPLKLASEAYELVTATTKTILNTQTEEEDAIEIESGTTTSLVELTPEESGNFDVAVEVYDTNQGPVIVDTDTQTSTPESIGLIESDVISPLEEANSNSSRYKETTSEYILENKGIESIDRVLISKERPEVTLQKWDGEVEMAVRYDKINSQASKSAGSDIIEWKSGVEEVHAYPLESSKQMENGGFEIEVVLNEKPETNRFNFAIDGYEDLDFFYQPPLSEEVQGVENMCTETQCTNAGGEIISERAENIVGSYAVYHKTKRDYYPEETNYQSGKVFHIYRPEIIDAEGQRTWGTLDYADGELSVTVPQEYLDNAVYPVIVDPTFGYTSAGGSSIQVGGSNYRGSLFTTPSDYGSFTSMSFYCDKATSGSENAKAVVVEHSTLNIATNGVSAAIACVNGAPAWKTPTFSTSPSLSANTEYLLGAIPEGNRTRLFYDTGVSNQGHSDGTNNYTTPANLGAANHDTRKYSAYITYSTGGGGNATPTAPSLLETEGQTNPTGITDSTPEFTAIFNDSDAGDIATHYQIQIATSSGFSSMYWDSSSTTLASTTNEGNRTPEISYTGSSLASSTTYYWRIKFWDDGGLEGDWSTTTASFSLNTGIPANATPTAPFLLETEGQTNPSDVTDSTPEFTAIYNDPDNGDLANFYRIQVATSTAFTSLKWDSAKTALATTTEGNRTGNISYAGAGLASSTTYYWRIKFWDDDDLEGDWSTTTASFSLASATSSNATPTEPISLEAEGQTNPTNITDPTPEFTAIYKDPDLSDLTNFYRIQVSTSSGFTSFKWDSNKMSLATTTQGNRTDLIAYGGSSLASSTTYYWRIKFWDGGGLEGDWSTTTSSFSLASGSSSTTSSETSYTYDDSGNLISAISESFTKLFTWNPLGLLATASLDGIITNFIYDAEGNRIGKTTPGSGGGEGGSGEATLLFSDTFTESSNTILTSHTPEIGSGWSLINTSGSGSGGSVHVEASSDQLKGATSDGSAGAMYSANTTYLTPNYQIKFTIPAAPTGDEYLNVGLRMDGTASNGYLLEGWWGDNHDPAIYKVSGGSFTELSLHDSSNQILFGNGDVVRGEIDGNDIAMFDDNDIAHVYTSDSTFSSANKAAVGYGAYRDSGGDIETTVPAVDNIEITDLPESTGWNNPATTGETHNNWTNPSNAQTSDNSRTTIAADTYVGTGSQDYGDFGFNIDSGDEILGIEVRVESLTDSSGWHDLAITVSQDNGSTWSSEKTIRYEDFDSVDGTKLAGHALSLWGLSWEPDDLADSDFKVKVRLASRESSTVDDLGIDHISVKVFHTEGEGGGGTATTTTRYVNDLLAPNALVLAETDEENNIHRYNIWGPDGLVSTGEASSSERYYPITDHHGSVRVLTDSSGNIVNSYTYTPYGEITASSSSPTTPYLYTGEEFDTETGLVYLRARYYDPDLGRFLSRDPLRGTLNNPLTQNPYQYALNNPVMYTDPSGEFVPLLVAWAVIELGLTAYDAYNTYNTLNDPCASDVEKALASSLFLAGIVGPGGGYGSVDDVGRAIFKNGYYEVNGLKFSKLYYEKLWDSGRPAPSLIANEIISSGAKGVPDSRKPGFEKIIYGGWELVWNPTTKEVWHLQPI